mgnify:CR=1 FL=1
MGRVINLVLSPIGISLENIAVITFTNKAAAELRHRIRIRFEELLAGNPEPSIKETILASLEQIDEATISTLHGFARHLLTEHSVEAELPPDFEVLQSQVLPSFVALVVATAAVRGDGAFPHRAPLGGLDEARGWIAEALRR